MIAIALLLGLQKPSNITGLPSGGDIILIGKLRPNHYTAMRDNHTLPKIGELSEAKRKVFTGKIIVLDFPHPGSVHVMNFRNGKRLVLENPKQKTGDNGAMLTKVLAQLSKKADVRFSGTNASGFEVNLPGEDKKLVGFQGTLVALGMKKGEQGISILVRNGKIVSSEWLNGSGLHGLN